MPTYSFYSDSKNVEKFKYSKSLTSNTAKLTNTEYNRKYIKTFELKGAYYRYLTPGVDSGKFIGYINHDYNEYDDYAFAVYNEFERHLGYLPRRNKKLYYHMEKMKVVRLPVWGTVYYDDYDGSWGGEVKVPLGYNNNELKMFVQIIDYCKKMDELKVKNERSVNDCVDLLKLHGEVKVLLSSLGNPKNHFYKFSKSLVPQISKQFEKNKCWQELIYLNEEHSELVNNLSERLKKSTLSRIEKAYNNAYRILNEQPKNHKEEA